MAWISGSGDGYTLVLTDGRLQSTPAARRDMQQRGVSLEQSVVEHVYSWGKSRGLPPPGAAGGRRLIPDPLHVWLLGSDTWLEGYDARTGTQAAPRDYRIAVLGFGRPEVSASVIVAWDIQLRRFGLETYGANEPMGVFAVAAALTLDQMEQYYRKTRSPPTPVLARLGVPASFCGDSY